MEHTPPNQPTNLYRVVQVARLYDDSEVEERRWDPFLLKMQHEDEGVVLWPVYWTLDRYHDWAWGQNPPELASADWRRLFGDLGIDWVR